ncbi:hypothetical protein F6455_08550 [Proteobacteria bacterium 005FR1]|nr:hypothetical protein [Proteobacteria bacterium 005FR1]
MIAQERLRHKTKKREFRIIFWLGVLLNISVLAWLHSSQGNAQLRGGLAHLENLAVTSLPHDDSVSAILLLAKLRAKPADWLRL